MTTIKGVVLELEDKEAIVLTDSGEFKRIPLRDRNLILGQEVTVKVEEKSYKKNRTWTQWIAAAAAAVLIAIMPWSGMVTNSAAIAYVSLEINPSVELTLNEDRRIIATEGFNSEGKRILVERSVKGMDAEKAIKVLTEQAVIDGFLKPGNDERSVILAVVPIKESPSIISLEKDLRRSVEEVVASKNVDANVLTVVASLGLRDKARQQGLSVAKYALVTDTIAKNKGIDIEVVKQNPIDKVVKDNGLNIEQILDQVNEENQQKPQSSDQDIVVAKGEKASQTQISPSNKGTNLTKDNNEVVEQPKPEDVVDGDEIVGPGVIAGMDPCEGDSGQQTDENTNDEEQDQNAKEDPEKDKDKDEDSEEQETQANDGQEQPIEEGEANQNPDTRTEEVQVP